MILDLHIIFHHIKAGGLSWKGNQHAKKRDDTNSLDGAKYQPCHVFFQFMRDLNFCVILFLGFPAFGGNRDVW